MNLQLCASHRRLSGGQTKPRARIQKKASITCRAQLKYTDSTYSNLVEKLSDHALGKLKEDAGKRTVIGIAGSPGSGKSTLTINVCKRVNEKLFEQSDGQSPSQLAIAVPMDGFHYYKRELDQFPDVKEAYKRRGAPWTFNAASFVSRMRRLKSDAHVSFPSFEHGIGDPKEDDILVGLHHALVLVEGNYLLLNQDPWSALRDERVLDEAWFLDVPLDDAMERVLARQLRMGTAEEVARHRILTNDRPNGELISRSKFRADVLIEVPIDESRA